MAPRAVRPVRQATTSVAALVMSISWMVPMVRFLTVG
jgi:hypothetical protein